MIASLHLSYVGVLLAVFAEQLCLPIPSVIFLMAAGALSANGEMRIDIIVLVSMIGCLAADGLWFWLGRRWGSQTLRLLSRFTANPRKCSENAHEKFRRYGPPVLCVAKFVPGLNLVMPPLVGAEGVAPTGFLALDTLGAFLWSGLYVGLGYAFSNQLDVAIGWVKHFGIIVGAVVGFSIGVYTGWRGLLLLGMIRRLRLRRITPRMLAGKLKSGNKVAVLDLLDFEASENSSPEAIPGAFRVDPSRLRHSPHLVVPDEVDIVLYSSSGGDTVPARAAMGLKRIGIYNVWVLEGGLKRWREQGFPLSETPELAEVAAARVGVKLTTA